MTHFNEDVSELNFRPAAIRSPMPSKNGWPAMNPAERSGEHHRRFAAAAGFRPAAGGCPRRVAGLRCQAHRNRTPCICEVHERVLDHARCWRNRRDELLLTSEPYVIDSDEITAYAADLADLGLKLTLTGASPWYPGRTLLCLVRRASMTAPFPLALVVAGSITPNGADGAVMFRVRCPFAPTSTPHEHSHGSPTGVEGVDDAIRGAHCRDGGTYRCRVRDTTTIFSAANSATESTE